jgi:hypothetical protein
MRDMRAVYTTVRRLQDKPAQDDKVRIDDVVYRLDIESGLLEPDAELAARAAAREPNPDR